MMKDEGDHMSPPEITTIIPTHCRPHLLKRAIRSALAQSYPFFSLHICDNASDDDTAEIVQTFMRKDSRIRYYRHEKKLPMLDNYLFGLNTVKTTFFSFLSDDDVLLPWFYETALEQFRLHPDSAFFAGSSLIVTEKGRITEAPLQTWKRTGHFAAGESIVDMIGRFPIPTSVLFQTSRVNSIKIDPTHPLTWDCDYLIHIAAQYPIVVSKKPCAFFTTHPNAYSNSQKAENWLKGFAQIQKKLSTHEFLPKDTIETSIKKLQLNINKTLFIGFCSAILKGDFDTAQETAKILSTQSLLDRRCQAARFISRFKFLMYLALPFLKILRKKMRGKKERQLQALFGEYLKWLQVLEKDKLS